MTAQPAVTSPAPLVERVPPSLALRIWHALVALGLCAVAALSVHLLWITRAGAALDLDHLMSYAVFLSVCAAAPFVLATLWRRHSRLTRDPRENTRPRWLSPGVASVVLSAGIASLILLVYQLGHETAQRSAQRRLEAVGTLKASLVRAWINDNSDDIRIWTTSPEFFRLIADWRSRAPGAVRAREQLIERLQEHARTSQYVEIGLRDAATGALLLTTGAEDDSADVRREAIAAAASPHPVLDVIPSASTSDQAVALNVGFLGAVELPGGGKLVIHVGIDPERELYPTIEQWPGDSATAEVLLMRREGSSMVVLNDTDAGPQGRVARRLESGLPLSLGAALIEGRVGYLEGDDDRGQRVLAFAQPVEGTPWILAAKLNRAQAFAELDRIVALAAANAGALLLIGAWWWLDTRRQVAAERQHQLERGEQALKLTELSRRVVSVQEHERRLLASELHDRTGANLATININLKAIANSVPIDAPGDVALMNETRELLADTVASIREFCGELRPAVLDYAGLAPAIEHHLTLFGRRTRMAAQLDHKGYTDRCAPAIESVLFRITQEALLNCAKHSGASKVSVSLASTPGQVTLVVADDGVGFATEQLGQAGQAPGNGLLTMRERAEFAGGTLAVESRPGAGTRITVRIG